MTIRRFLTILGACCAILAGPAIGVPLAQTATAEAAVTAIIGGEDGGGAFSWQISYDDQTRAVTTTAAGTGFCFVTVQVTASITRTVAYYPVAGGESINPDLAARMAAADFRVTADGSTVTLASGIPPAQVRRIVGKVGAVGGFVSEAEWSRA